MTERDWELYRLSVAGRLPEGPYKHATIAGINHKLHLLDQEEPTTAPLPREASRRAAAAGAATSALRTVGPQ
jgi:hypothetical protein